MNQKIRILALVLYLPLYFSWIGCVVEQKDLPLSDSGLTPSGKWALDQYRQDEHLAYSHFLMFVTIQFGLVTSLKPKEYEGSLRGDIVLNAIKKNISIMPSGEFLFMLRDSWDDADPELPPFLAFAGKRADVERGTVVLIPDYDAISGYGHQFSQIDQSIGLHPWETRLTKGFWRGSTTGGFFEPSTWEDMPRSRLVKIAQSSKFFSAAFTAYPAPQFRNDNELDLFKRLFPPASFISIVDSLRYRYLIDVDGNTCTNSRMAWILYSGSLLLKHKSDNIQWYYGKLKPMHHYLPVAEDFSNLEQQIQWAKVHDQEARQMAVESRKLAEEIFSEQEVAKSLALALRDYQSRLPEHYYRKKNRTL